MQDLNEMHAVGAPKIIIQHLLVYLIVVYVLAITGIKTMKDLRFVGEVQQCLKICITRLMPALATEKARWLKNEADLKPSSLRKTQYCPLNQLLWLGFIRQYSDYSSIIISIIITVIISGTIIIIVKHQSQK